MQEIITKIIIRRQRESPNKGPWVNLEINDLKEIKIDLSFSQIEELPKTKFKNIEKDACNNASFLSLLKEKDKTSTGKYLYYESLETEPYFFPSSGANLETMRRIFHTRSRKIDVKANFRSA